MSRTCRDSSFHLNTDTDHDVRSNANTDTVGHSFPHSSIHTNTHPGLNTTAVALVTSD